MLLTVFSNFLKFPVFLIGQCFVLYQQVIADTVHNIDSFFQTQQMQDQIRTLQQQLVNAI